MRDQLVPHRHPNYISTLRSRETGVLPSAPREIMLSAKQATRVLPNAKLTGARGRSVRERPPVRVRLNARLGLCTRIALAREQDIKQRSRCWRHSNCARANELAVRDEHFDVDGFEDPLHLARPDKFAIEARHDADKLPTRFLEPDLHVGNLKRCQAVNHSHPHSNAHGLHEGRETLAKA